MRIILKKFFFDCNGFREGYYFKIHIEPLYPGGLIFDGVDDYGICKNLPYLEDFTIIVKRSYDYNTSNFSGSIISKSVGYKQGEFLFEFKDTEQNIYNFYIHMEMKLRLINLNLLKFLG